MKLIRPWADFEEANAPVANTLYENPGTAWAIAPQWGTNHTALFEIESTHQAVFQGGTKLSFTLDFVSQLVLGRFRLSVSGNDGAYEAEQLRFAVLKQSDPLAKLAAAYALNGRIDKALEYFSRALRRAEGYSARKELLGLAARFDEIISALVKQQPDDTQLQWASARNLATSGKQSLAEKQPAKAIAELEQSREILTRLLTKYPKPQWSVLKPTKIVSKGGATLRRLDDDSILAGGINPQGDTYTITTAVPVKRVTAIRLEAIPDRSLPYVHRAGPSRVGTLLVNGRPHPKLSIPAKRPTHPVERRGERSSSRGCQPPQWAPRGHRTGDRW